MPVQGWHRVTPAIKKGGRGIRLLREGVRCLTAIHPGNEDSASAIRELRESMLTRALDCGPDSQVVRVCASILCDLRAQGWDFELAPAAILIRAPQEEGDVLGEKARVRAGLLVERDQQLLLPSVRRFIKDMERRRLGPHGRWVSIFSLMRDGEDLAQHLTSVLTDAGDTRVQALRGVVRPYIQIVDDSVCEHTGLRLKDIWRYFRHTWASPHKSLPGRNLWLLIRDEAADNHPIIGIAALGSAVVQLNTRDEWIGWTPDVFIERLKAEASDEWASWLTRQIDRQLESVYYADFVEDGIVTDAEIATPTVDVVRLLRAHSEQARETHRLFGSAREHKNVRHGEAFSWVERARTHLFASKRAATLADILEDRLWLQCSGFTRPSAHGLSGALQNRLGRKAVARTLRRLKASHVGIDMLDVTVCGAVPPYNHLIGGKLVALLLTSPEVRLAYEQRYSDRASVIASSMAGRPVHRAPRLVLLGTTSLYGVGSSQYNRLRMPASEVAGNPGAEIRYIQRDVTKGYGSFHFSAATMTEIRTLYAHIGNGRRVKHIFGEGANPRMREVREALDVVGLPADRVLRHGSSRVVYAIPLATNFREVLLEQELEPEYIVPADDPPVRTAQIVDYWIRRWLQYRIERSDVLRAVGSHATSYPVQHGARVRLPT